MTVSVRLALLAGLLALMGPAASHDDTIGARYVGSSGINAEDCLEHHDPCRSLRYALARARPGDTIKLSAGVYYVGGIDPESFLFGANHAKGGYEPGGHFDEQDPERWPTILVGLDPRYRQVAMRHGFRWAADLASAQQGIVDDSPAPALQATALVPASCVQGSAGQFPCRHVDFQAQIALNGFSSRPTSAANVWGFVDLNDNREYAVIGLSNGTAVVDVTNPASPREVATVPGNTSAWREVKIFQEFHAPTSRYRAFAYVTTEANGAGLQVINLGGLPGSVSLATTLADTGSQHTDYVSNIDYATNMALPGAQAFLWLAGSNVGGGSWRVYSLANAAQPQFIRQAPNAGYVHDATSLLVTDARVSQCAPGHDPCEVYVDFNENSVDLWDVTDKANPVRLSSTTYSNANYTHSGWPTADQRHIFVHDELEEIRRGLFTQIYTMNVDDLRNPFIVASYQGPDTTTDHNGYVKGNLLYVSHYRRGLVIFDATDPMQLREIGHFDTFIAPAANTAGFDGAWGVYPFLPSGTILVSDITNGLFVLRDRAAGLAQSAGQVGFVGLAVSVSENAGTARVTVRRNNGYSGAVSVDYATSDGTAIAGTDYTATSGTLNWGAGDLGERVINVPVINDTQAESSETFRITLSNAAGGVAIEGSATIDVTITDNDAVLPPGPGNRGGGGAVGAGLLWLLGLGLLAAPGATRRHVRAAARSPSNAPAMPAPAS
ncbi:MAG: choice-of-anchor B family protein [Steroidobacteraceae bacterium]|nr:choice-of-anchor B family protein [Steroidobacteraceae bacterium]